MTLKEGFVEYLAVRISGSSTVKQIAGSSLETALSKAEEHILSITGNKPLAYLANSGFLPSPPTGGASVAIIGKKYYTGGQPMPTVEFEPLIESEESAAYFAALDKESAVVTVIDGSPEKYTPFVGLAAAAQYLAAKGASINYRGESSYPYSSSVSNVVVMANGLLLKGRYIAGVLNLS